MQTLEGIVNGLVYLHEKGFVHRDLKLSNILVVPVSSLLQVEVYRHYSMGRLLGWKEETAKHIKRNVNGGRKL